MFSAYIVFPLLSELNIFCYFLCILHYELKREYTVKIILFVFTIVLGVTIQAQNTPTQHLICSCNYTEFPDSIDLPKVQTLEIDCPSAEIQFLSLKELTGLDTLIVRSDGSVDMKALTKMALEAENLSVIELKGLAFSSLPKKARKLTCASLQIEDNPLLSLESSISVFGEMKNLLTLQLPNNTIDEIPASISELKNLRELNLSNNQISELPEEFENLENLETVELQGNMFLDPLASYLNVSPRKLKLFIADADGLSNSDKRSLSRKYRRADVQLIGEREEPKVKSVADTNENIADLQNDSVQKNTPPAKKVGSFTIQQNVLKAYSPAYAIFPSFFNARNLNPSFDTTSFSDRYLNYDYYNVHPCFYYNNGIERSNRRRIEIEPGDKSVYYVDLYRKMSPFRKELMFSFYPNNRKYTSIRKLNPELKAFNQFVWVYAGELSKNEFRSKYLHERFRDIRIYNTEKGATFVIELKTDSDHVEFQAYPIFRSRRYSLTDAQVRYEETYQRYQKYLESRAKRFDKKLARSKWKFERNRDKIRQSAWKRFQDLYMSAEERLLSYDEWIEYYQNIIANEKLAFYNADASRQNFIQGLILEGFNVGLFNAQDIDSTYIMRNLSFVNMEDKTLAVTDVIVVDRENGTFINLPGTLNSQPVNIFLSGKKEYEVVVFLLNGDVGVSHSTMFISNEGDHKVKLNIIPKKLASVGQIYRNIGM